MDSALRSYASLAEEATFEASKVVLAAHRNPQRITKKADDTYVTETDKESEQVIINFLKQHTPEFGIYAEEETNGSLERKEYTWIIDPLDGTDNFYLGFPHFAVSIALEHNGEIIAAATALPLEGLMLTATKSGGFFVNKEQTYVSKRPLSEGLLLIDTYWDFMDYRVFKQFSPKVRNLGVLNSACTSIAYVAMGRADMFIDRVDKPWDIAAGSLFVQEAGGKITNLQGGTFDLYKPECVASNGVAHEEVISLLKPLEI
jgi:myo-inositol-1(or 4)-monophosphatase